jgi:molybdopterin synthase catalytic subunit
MIEITSDPILTDRIVDSVKKDENGAVIVFIGSVRDTCNEGKKVTSLEIDLSGPDAEARLRDIASDISTRWQLRDIAISRRIGKLPVGEVALVIAISAPHRQEAFEACQYAVDVIKKGGITIERDIHA